MNSEEGAVLNLKRSGDTFSLLKQILQVQRGLSLVVYGLLDMLWEYCMDFKLPTLELEEHSKEFNDTIRWIPGVL